MIVGSVHCFAPLLLQAMPPISQLLPFVAIAAVFYFVMIRPQQKQATQQKAMLAALKKGDSVITQSGMFGKIVQVGDKDLVLEVAVGSGSTRVRWLKSQIAGLEPVQKATVDEPKAEQST